MNAEYDRKLICFMLKYLATFPESMLAHTHGSIEEQARLLRCADNREAVGIHTETNTAATGMGELIDRLNFEAAALIATKGRVPESSDVSLLREAAAALAAQPAPADFDTWYANPYTKILMKSVSEDYEPKGEQSRPMATAPKDGTIVRLLVRFTENGFEDAGPEKAVWTIGQNGADHHPEDDEWMFAGWNWEQDCFTQGVGEPIGWLPMIAIPAQPAPVVGGDWVMAPREATTEQRKAGLRAANRSFDNIGEIYAAMLTARPIESVVGGWIDPAQKLPPPGKHKIASDLVLVRKGDRLWMDVAYYNWKPAEHDFMQSKFGDFKPRFYGGVEQWMPMEVALALLSARPGGDGEAVVWVDPYELMMVREHGGMLVATHEAEPESKRTQPLFAHPAQAGGEVGA